MGKLEKPRGPRIPIIFRLKIAIPCIVIGCAFGAVAGIVLDSIANGMRVGIILGGVTAFIILLKRQKKLGAS
jgi:hypothetical protein